MDIIWFKDCSYNIKNIVGGKNASLGELYSLSQNYNFNIANGFAISTIFYDYFIKYNNIDEQINKLSENINNIDNIEILDNMSSNLKTLILESDFSENHKKLLETNYNLLKQFYNNTIQVAVRSSAIAEDLPDASFAGQQDTFLNVTNFDDLLNCIKKCFASLFNSRAISYRFSNNIQLDQIKISVGIQKMVRSDLGSSGVAFSIDPETGYNKAVVINSTFGLGELLVSGGIKPDEIIIDKRICEMINYDPIIMKKLGSKNSKIIYDNNTISEVETNLVEKINFSLENNKAIELARLVLILEKNYSKLFKKPIAVDIEWALDGYDNEIYILQSRPETIHSNKDIKILEKYELLDEGELILEGVSVGEKISSGSINILENMHEHTKFNKGDILVTDMTTPDWEPVMKKANGIITNKGGRTCHAAIVAREMGLNAIVGTGNCTKILNNMNEVTMCNSFGEIGRVYKDKLNFRVNKLEINTNKKIPVNLMLNVGSPDNVFSASLLPNSGIGLARLEFIISNYIKIHPLALLNYPDVPENIRLEIFKILGNRDNGEWFFIKRLARCISKIASAVYPNDTIIRLSDFKTNEYKNLIGGELYEPNEENPMLGWRGASRYYSKEYLKGFIMECKAIKYARNNMGMDNIIIMIPFCRTPEECNKIINIMKENGLERGVNGLKIYLMCEIPSNVIEADKFSPYIDGVSIGGNDLLQLTLGVDRDSDRVSYLTDHTNLSYRRLIKKSIEDYKKYNIKVGFCGQQPSDSIEFTNFLIESGIDSISVTPDALLKTIKNFS